MFNERISAMGLLEHKARDNILKAFPQPVIRSLVNLVSEFLSSCPDINEALPTDIHVEWVIDCLGYGFTMPIESEKISQMCLSLYNSWLSPTTRPASMNERLPYFLNKMAKQVSLIFVPRAKNKDEAETHANLCRQGLIFYFVYSRMELSHEDREDLLKLILGVTDCVLNPAPGVEPTLCKCLAGEMLHTLFEIWLYSKTKNDYLWSVMLATYPKWAYLMETVSEWNAAIKGFLEYIIDELYYPEKQTKTLHFPSSLELPSEYIHYAWNRIVPLLGDANIIKNSEPHSLAIVGISQAIQQMLEVVKAELPGAPDVNTILDVFGHDLFEAAYLMQPLHEAGTATAIDTLCRTFTICRAVSADKRYLGAYYNAIRSCLNAAEESPILINTLHCTKTLFAQGYPGARLLIPHYVRMLRRVADSQLLTRPKRNRNGEDLIASCISILSTILSVGTRYQGTKFPPSSMTTEQIEAERKRQQQNKTVIPVSIEELIANEGSNLNNSKSGKNGGKNKEEIPEKPLPNITCYNDLEPHIGRILIRLLENDTLLPVTRDSLLWQSYVFLREYLPSTANHNGTFDIDMPRPELQFAPCFAWTFSMLVFAKIGVSRWPVNVSLTALNVLGMISTLYDNLFEPVKYASRIVESLVRYINNKIKLSQKVPGTAVLVASSFEVITRWAMTGPWLAASRNVFQHVVETCLVCMERDKRMHISAQPAEVVDAALRCFLTVVNRWGVFPNSLGPERISPLINEEIILRRIMEKHNLTLPDVHGCIRYYAIGTSTIVTFIDIPELAERDSITTVVILRDRTGKYVWNTKFHPLLKEDALFLSTEDKKKSDDDDDDGASIVDKCGHNDDDDDDTVREQCTTPYRSDALRYHADAFISAEATQMWIQDVYTSLNSIEVENIYPAVRALADAKTQFGIDTNYFITADVTVKAPVREEVESLLNRDPARCISGRLLATHLGYFTPYGRATLTPIKPCTTFYEGIKDLDNLPERSTLSIAVLYQKVGMNESDAFSLDKSQCPSHFLEFAKSLGWDVNVGDHMGYLGGFDRKGSMGKHITYYSDYNTEVVFHISPLIENESESDRDKDEDEKKKELVMRRRRVVGKDNVLIMWSDDDSYNDKVFPNMKHDIKIIINPIPRADGLYKVVVRCSDRVRSKPGPLYGTMVVSKRALAPLVRLSAISGHQSVSDIENDTVNPFALRQACITSIIRAYRKNVHPTKLFESQFFYDINQDEEIVFKPRIIEAKKDGNNNDDDNDREERFIPSRRTVSDKLFGDDDDDDGDIVKGSDEFTITNNDDDDNNDDIINGSDEFTITNNDDDDDDDDINNFNNYSKYNYSVSDELTIDTDPLNAEMALDQQQDDPLSSSPPPQTLLTNIQKSQPSSPSSLTKSSGSNTPNPLSSPPLTRSNNGAKIGSPSPLGKVQAKSSVGNNVPPPSTSTLVSLTSLTSSSSSSSSPSMSSTSAKNDAVGAASASASGSGSTPGGGNVIQKMFSLFPSSSSTTPQQKTTTKTAPQNDNKQKNFSIFSFL